MKILKFILLLSICGCTKRDLDNIFLNNSIKANYLFQKGSYWIYRDSISGRVDSFYLDSVKHIVPPPTSYRRSDQEYFQLYITQESTLYSKDTISWLLEFYAPSLLRGTYRRNFGKYNLNIINLYVLDMLHPVVNSNYLPKEDSASINKLSRLDLKTYSFKDVLMVSQYNKLQKNIGATYYLSENVGLVKMSINYDNDTFKINEVWELQRWNVIK